MNTFLKNIQKIRYIAMLCILFCMPYLVKAQQPNPLNCSKFKVSVYEQAKCNKSGKIKFDTAGIGGVQPYNFSISGGGLNNLVTSDTFVLALNGGFTYSVTFFDALNHTCTKTVSVLDLYSKMVLPLLTQNGCDLVASVQNGKPPYDYFLYSSAPTTTSVPIATTFQPSTPPNPPNPPSVLSPTYTFTNVKQYNATQFWLVVRDTCGEQVQSLPASIFFPNIPVNLTLLAGNQLEVKLNLGPNPPPATYTYQLFTGGTTTNPIQTATSNSTTFVFPQAVVANCAGYYVKVKSSNCSEGNQVYIFPNSTPQLIVKCVNFNTGEADVEGSLGKPPYKYKCYANNNGIAILGDVNGHFTNLPINGVYSFEIVDDCGAKGYPPNNQFMLPNLTLTQISANCPTGKATIGMTIATAVANSKIFYPIKATCSTCVPLVSQTFNTPNFVVTDLTISSFIVEITDNCGNSLGKFKDTLDINLSSPGCKKIKTSYFYAIKKLNSVQQWNTNLVGTHTFTLSNSAGTVIEVNNTGIFQAPSYGTYKVKMTTDCGFIKEKEIVLNPPAGGAAPPMSITYNCVNGTFTGNVSVSSTAAPFALINDAIPPVVLTSPTGSFSSIPLGSYTLETCDGQFPITVKNPPVKKEIPWTKIQYCKNGNFAFTVTAQSYQPTPAGPYTLYNNQGVSLFVDQYVFNDLVAGTYWLKSPCSKETIVELVNPDKLPIPYTFTLECKGTGSLSYTINASGVNGPYTLGNFQTKDGFKFENIPPGTYTLNSDCALPTTIVLPAFPTMPKIQYTSVFNCISGYKLTAKTKDIAAIWQKWKVDNFTNAPFSFSNNYNICGNGAKFLLKNQQTNVTYGNPNSFCQNDSLIAIFNGLQPGMYILTLESTCVEKEEITIEVKPYVSKLPEVSRGIICDGQTKAKVKIWRPSNTIGLFIFDIKDCKANSTFQPLHFEVMDTIIECELPVGEFCISVKDPCNDLRTTRTEIKKTGSIIPNYWKECGFVTLNVKKYDYCTYQWIEKGSFTSLSDSTSLRLPLSLNTKTYIVTIHSEFSNCDVVREIILKPSDGAVPDVEILEKDKYFACFGGSVDLSANIKNLPIDTVVYQWVHNGIEISKLINNSKYSATKAGWYYLLTKNKYNCFTKDSIKIVIPTQKLDAKPVKKNLTCFQSQNGTIDIKAEGGVLPYKYLWSNGQTTAKAVGLSKGIYSCTVTDSIKCTTIHTITITEPDLLAAKIKQKNTNNCDANWNIVVTGGTTPYQVSFDGNPAVTTSDSTLLCVKVGTHTVNVTDANGCKFSITETFQKHDLPIKEQWVNVCFGAKYQVQKSYGKGKEYSQSGTYTDILSANVSCGACDTMFITHLTVLKELKVTAKVSSLFKCIDGSVKGEVTSIVGGMYDVNQKIVAYQWSTGGNGPEYQTKDITLLNSPSPHYLTVTVVDELGCRAWYPIGDLYEIPKILLPPVDPPLCHFDKCGGSIELKPNYGYGSIPTSIQPEFHYLWNDGIKTAKHDSICPSKEYKATITDKYGCIITFLGKLNVPPQLAIEFVGNSDKEKLCKGSKEKVKLKIRGWNYTDSTGTLINNQKKYKFLLDGKPAFVYDSKEVYFVAEVGIGKHTIKMSVPTGCEIDTVLEVKEFPALQTAIVQKDSLCKGSSVILTGKLNPAVTVKETNWYDSNWKKLGIGTTPLSVNTGGTWFLVQADNNGCIDTVKQKVTEFENPKAEINGIKIICGNMVELTGTVTNNIYNHKYSYKWSSSSKDTLATIQVTKAGTYTLTITDLVTKCNMVLSAEVKNGDGNITEIKQKTTLCNGKSTILDAGVGFGTNIKIKWYKDAVFQPKWNDQDKITVTEAGDYYIEATIGTTCNLKSGIFNLKMLPNPDLTLVPDVNICNAKTTTLSPKSNTSPLTYVWSNGEKTTAIDVKAGSYSVTATDVNGCQTTAVADVKEYPIVPISFAKAKKICPKDTISLSLNEIFTAYLWSDKSTKSILNITKSGTYSVTVTNDKGCTTTAQITVEDAIPVTPILSTKPSCPDTKGTVTLTNPSDFTKTTWDDGSTGSSISFDKVTKFSIKTIDKNECPSEAKITTAMFEKPKVTPIAPTVCQGSSGTIKLSESFSTYAWNDGSTASTLSVSKTGTYYVTVTDANGCIAQAFAAVTILPNPSPTISAPDEVCIGDPVTLEVEKGFAKYVWSSNPSTTFSATYPTVGTFLVTVTDNNGCVGTATKTVGTADGLKVVMNAKKVCSGEKVTLNPGKYDTYLWSNGEVTQTIDVLTPGTYTVSVSIGNCKGVGSVTVKYFDLPKPIITGKDLPCFGEKTILNINYPKNTWSTKEIDKDNIQVFAGTYTVMVTDTNGCKATTSITITERPKLVPEIVNDEQCDGKDATLGLKNPFVEMTWANGAKTQSITVQKAGTYSVSVVDANGCKGESFAKASYNPLPKVTCQATKTPVCPSEKTTIVANSPTATNFIWSNKITDKSQIVGVGEYAVTATDAKGCKAADTLLIKEFKPISASLEVKGLKLCSKDSSTFSLKFVGLDGQKANVTISDGTGFFTVKNISNDTIFTVKPSVDKVFSIQKIDVAGYDCDIKFDKKQTFEVKVSQLYGTLTGTSQRCYGTIDGSIALNTNATQMTWNNANFANSKDITNLPAGFYAVTIADDLGCSLALNTTLTEPKPIDMALQVTKTCIDQSNGSVEIKASGGAGNLTYYFNTKPYNDGKMPNLAKGTYTAMVKDKNGCSSKTQNVKIENFPITTVKLYAEDTSTITKGYDSLNIEVVIKVDGRRVTDIESEGFQEFSIQPYSCPKCLNFFAKTDSSTTYKVKLVDKNGCPASDKLRIGVKEVVHEIDHPNAVTDGNKFTILPKQKSVRKINALRIFDRWGNLVYQELNFKPSRQIGWDGTFRGVDCDPGVYAWIAIVEFLDEEIKIFHGDITVVR
jgi:SprB repeat/CHU_C Type IX secretion signal domain